MFLPVNNPAVGDEFEGQFGGFGRRAGQLAVDGNRQGTGVSRGLHGIDQADVAAFGLLVEFWARTSFILGCSSCRGILHDYDFQERLVVLPRFLPQKFAPGHPDSLSYYRPVHIDYSTNKSWGDDRCVPWTDVCPNGPLVGRAFAGRNPAAGL